jgi:hypothetical protein
MKRTTNRTGRRRTLAGIATATLVALLPGRRVVAKGEVPIVPGINRIKGDVTINGKPAELGMLVREGDVIVTGRGAEAVFVVGADAFLQRERTDVRFGSDAARALRILTGGLLSVFGKGERRLVVSTATIGIRGTACYVEVEETRSYFCLCYGEADIRPSADPSQRRVVTTRHHDLPMYLGGAPGASVFEPAKVINHTDDELVFLEGLVGRAPPFQGRDDYRY